jgi:hypothetical protein
MFRASRAAGFFYAALAGLSPLRQRASSNRKARLILEDPPGYKTRTADTYQQAHVTSHDPAAAIAFETGGAPAFDPKPSSPRRRVASVGPSKHHDECYGIAPCGLLPDLFGTTPGGQR